MPDSMLDALPKLIAANADAARAEGESALNEAKAAHEQALASGDAARAEAIWEALGRMEQDFAVLDAECKRARADADWLSRQAHAASMLLQGVPIAAFGHAVDAYRYFVKQAVLEDGTGPMFDELNPRQITGDQFFLNGSSLVPWFNPPMSVNNPLMLVDWAIGIHYLPRIGTPAYQAYVAVFRSIADVFRKNIQAEYARAAEARAAVLAAWKPGGLLLPTAPEKKEANGAHDSLPA